MCTARTRRETETLSMQVASRAGVASASLPSQGRNRQETARGAIDRTPPLSPRNAAFTPRMLAPLSSGTSFTAVVAAIARHGLRAIADAGAAVVCTLRGWFGCSHCRSPKIPIPPSFLKGVFVAANSRSETGCGESLLPLPRTPAVKRDPGAGLLVGRNSIRAWPAPPRSGEIAVRLSIQCMCPWQGKREA
jgi:hypothetical protein